MRLLKILSLLITLIMISCDKESDSLFQFEGEIIGAGTDCHGVFLIDLTSSNDSDISIDTYYIDNLPDEYKESGVKLNLNCRKPNIDEHYACTTLGPGYLHLIYLDGELNNE